MAENRKRSNVKPFEAFLTLLGVASTIPAARMAKWLIEAITKNGETISKYFEKEQELETEVLALLSLHRGTEPGDKASPGNRVLEWMLETALTDPERFIIRRGGLAAFLSTVKNDPKYKYDEMFDEASMIIDNLLTSNQENLADFVLNEWYENRKKSGGEQTWEYSKKIVRSEFFQENFIKPFTNGEDFSSAINTELKKVEHDEFMKNIEREREKERKKRVAKARKKQMITLGVGDKNANKPGFLRYSFKLRVWHVTLVLTLIFFLIGFVMNITNPHKRRYGSQLESTTFLADSTLPLINDKEQQCNKL